MFFSGRMAWEAKTIEAMIRLYCRRHHGGGRELCSECRELEEYAQKRLALCPFQEGKTTCGNCPVHCYKPEMRKRVRTVMREIGPKMIFYHPIMALRHLLDGLRKTPKKKK
ncbi:MAG: nitrous oxide-stimulated promoter family protein [Thermodesulfobacteriota bacterium]